MEHSFEYFASRVVNLLIAGVFGIWTFALQHWWFLLLVPPFLLRAAVGFDLRSARKWWAVLVIYGVTGLAMAWAIHNSRGFWISERWLLLVFFACTLAQVLLLISGRLRGVWSFARKA